MIKLRTIYFYSCVLVFPGIFFVESHAIFNQLRAWLRITRARTQMNKFIVSIDEYKSEQEVTKKAEELAQKVFTSGSSERDKKEDLKNFRTRIASTEKDLIYSRDHHGKRICNWLLFSGVTFGFTLIVGVGAKSAAAIVPLKFSIAGLVVAGMYKFRFTPARSQRGIDYLPFVERVLKKYECN